MWALVLEVLKVQFLYATTVLFTSLFRNLVNSANAHHDLRTILIHILMIVEMFVIVSLPYIIVIMDIIHFRDVFMSMTFWELLPFSEYW